MMDQVSNVFTTNKVDQFEHGAVQQVVLVAINLEDFHHRIECIHFNEVAVVELIFQAHARAQETNG